ARDLRCHDVAIVAVGDRDECSRVLDSGRAQDVLVDACADDGVAPKVCREAPERTAVDINNRHLMLVVVEDRGDAGADTAAAHDYHVHRQLVSIWPRSAGAARTTITSHGAFNRT